MEIVNSYDREDLKEQAQRAIPFPFVLIDEFLQSEFAVQLVDSYPTLSSVVEMGKQFRTVNERLKIQVTDSERFPGPAKRLCTALKSKAFMEDLEYIFDIPKLRWDSSFAGGGIHQTASSGRLDVHVDFNYLKQSDLHRRLNLLIYLNPEWKDSWGGAAELWDKDVKTCHHSILPIMNRCVIFRTSEISYHGVTAVSCPGNITRKSFAVYYYTKEPPPGWTGDSHSTIFRARPDEKFKKYIQMPLEKFQKDACKMMRRTKSQVKNILERR